MKKISANSIRELIKDIEKEIDLLTQLERGVIEVREEIKKDPERASIFYESLALKMHNFYTGCERIFQLIASELNGALPSSYDWHKRLLNRMTAEREEMPAVLSQETAIALQEYLGFRHVVRNLYGFELEKPKVDKLVAEYPAVWHQLKTEIGQFTDWLQAFAEHLETNDD
jgi:hypothetical protein